jgi:glycosyltransferase involved in cell wall biosynthesis
VERVCILNSYELRPNTGGAIGVIRESFNKVSGRSWELRHTLTGGRPSRSLRYFSRIATPWLRRYSRRCRLTQEIENHVASFLSVPGVREYPVVWFHDLIPYFACRPFLRRSQRAVLQLQYPELPSQEAANHGWYNDCDIALIERLQRWALADADALVLANRFAEQIYGALLANTRRIVYLQNAVAEPQVGDYPLLSADHTNVVFVGRRNRVKGFDVLLEAFGRAHDTDNRLKLYLCGGGDRVDRPGVIDLGFSQAPEQWLAAASCVVAPNRSSYMDLNVLQALSLNKPLIMSCSQGHEELRGASPAICEVQPGSVESLTAALLGAPRWLATLGAGCHDNRSLYERRFSLTAFEACLDEVCQGLLRVPATLPSR